MGYRKWKWKLKRKRLGLAYGSGLVHIVISIIWPRFSMLHRQSVSLSEGMVVQNSAVGPENTHLVSSRGFVERLRYGVSLRRIGLGPKGNGGLPEPGPQPGLRPHSAKRTRQCQCSRRLRQHRRPPAPPPLPPPPPQLPVVHYFYWHPHRYYHPLRLRVYPST